MFSVKILTNPHQIEVERFLKQSFKELEIPCSFIPCPTMQISIIINDDRLNSIGTIYQGEAACRELIELLKTCSSKIDVAQPETPCQCPRCKR